MADNQDIGVIFDLVKAVYQIDFSSIAKALGINTRQITSYKQGHKKASDNFIDLIWKTYPQSEVAYYATLGVKQSEKIEDVDRRIDEEIEMYQTTIKNLNEFIEEQKRKIKELESQ